MSKIKNKCKINYLKCKIGLETVGVLSSNGSTIIVNPLVYVETRVARCVIKIIGLKSVKSDISNVLNKEASLSAQNFNGLRSMHTLVCTSFRNPAGDSCTTCCTRSLVLRYSINRFKKLIKCSAFRIFPGTTSVKILKIYIRVLYHFIVFTIKYFIW